MNCGCLVDADIQDAEGEVIDSRRMEAPEDGGECCECGRLPSPGETFLFEWIRWESGDEFFLTCPDCESIRKNLCCSWIYENVLDDVKFEIREEMGADAMIPESCMLELTPAARLMVADMIDDAWERCDETWGGDDD